MADQAEEDVLASVGTAPDQACQALEAERQRDRPQTGAAVAAVTVDIAVTSVRHTNTAKEL